ncbi:MAG: hypothetical protein OS130_10055 [Thermodesulfobacteriota bacterium]|nr:MAG: hypothetical protein OS130_10055 [Thermodesulfobacteriota bacterium]
MDLYHLSIENQTLFQSAWQGYRESPLIAIEKLDEILAQQKNIFAYSAKARILLYHNTPIEALQAIEDGLGCEAKCYFLLAQKAHLLTYGFLNSAPPQGIPEPLKEAANCIEKALYFFVEVQKETKEEIQKVAYMTLSYLEEYNSEMSLRNLATNIGFLLHMRVVSNDFNTKSNFLFSANQLLEKKVDEKIDNIEKKVDEEKTRNIERLGLFTAAIALIFSMFQFTASLNTVTDILIAISGAGLVLICFMLGLHMIVNKDARVWPFWVMLIACIGVLILLFSIAVSRDKSQQSNEPKFKIEEQKPIVKKQQPNTAEPNANKK